MVWYWGESPKGMVGVCKLKRDDEESKKKLSLRAFLMCPCSITILSSLNGESHTFIHV